MSPSARTKSSSSPLVLLAVLLVASRMAKCYEFSDALTPASSSSSYSSAAAGGGPCPQGMVGRVKYDKRCEPSKGMSGGGGSENHPEAGPPNCKVFPVSTCVYRSVFRAQQQLMSNVVQPQQQPVVTPYMQPQQPSMTPYMQPQEPVVTPYVQQQQPSVTPYVQQPSVTPYMQPQQPVVTPYVQPQQPVTPYVQPQLPYPMIYGQEHAIKADSQQSHEDGYQMNVL